jgi:hypothetical protein
MDNSEPSTSPFDEWSRIAADLRATTGRELVLRCHAGTGGWADVEMSLDGEGLGAFGHTFPADPESALANLAGDLQEFALDREIGGGWPTCPDHHTHPVEARTNSSGRAAWFCPAGGQIAEIGELTTIG